MPFRALDNNVHSINDFKTAEDKFLFWSDDIMSNGHVNILREVTLDSK